MLEPDYQQGKCLNLLRKIKASNYMQLAPRVLVAPLEGDPTAAELRDLRLWVLDQKDMWDQNIRAEETRGI